MKKLITAGCGIIVIVLITYMSSLSSTHAMEGNESDSYEYEYYYNSSDDYEGDNMSDSIASKTVAYKGNEDEVAGGAVRLPETIDTDADSITVFINKEYALPSSYIPKELVIPDIKFFSDGSDEKRYMRKEAAEALETMFAAAKDSGNILYGVSGYRSYSRQSEIYTNNIRERGRDATNKVSAIPGHSEHQTGLAIDISCKELNGSLSEKFAYTSEGQWVSDNCYKYGFIIRYPKEKDSITGYTYEPWHIRYVGIDVATYLYDNGLTLEEYYNYIPSIDMSKDIISDAATAEVVASFHTEAPATATPAGKSEKASSKDTGKSGKKTSGQSDDKDDTKSMNNTDSSSANVPSDTTYSNADSPAKDAVSDNNTNSAAANTNQTSEAQTEDVTLYTTPAPEETPVQYTPEPSAAPDINQQADITDNAVQQDSIPEY